MEVLLQEEGPACVTLRNELSGGDARADKARAFIEKGHPAGEQQVKGNQEDCSAMWLRSLGFYGDGTCFPGCS